jgi:hypothetical protein
MENLNEMKRFLEEVDSIQRRYIEIINTGKRNSIFREKARPSLESEGEAHQPYIDSQRGTF